MYYSSLSQNKTQNRFITFIESVSGGQYESYDEVFYRQVYFYTNKSGPLLSPLNKKLTGNWILFKSAPVTNEVSIGAAEAFKEFIFELAGEK